MKNTFPPIILLIVILIPVGKVRKLILILALIIPAGLNAQVTQEWVAQYFGIDSSGVLNVPSAMVIDNERNIIVTGFTYRSVTSYDFVTIKYSPAGKLLWRVTYNGPNNEYDKAIAVEKDNSGNILVTGFSRGTQINVDIVVIKYNSHGILQWVRRHGENDNFDDNIVKNCLAVNSNGDIYISTRSKVDNINIGSNTIKYNTNGDLIWNKNRVNFEPLGISLDNSDNLIITGRTQPPGNYYDYLTVKYSSSGDLIWEAIYNGPKNEFDIPYALTVDKRDNIYVTGGSNVSYDILTVKYDSTGKEIWVSRYNGSGDGPDVGKSIAVDDSQNVYIVGTVFIDVSHWDLITLGLDNNGVLKWEHQFGETTSHPPFGGFSIKTDENGSIYVSGPVDTDSNSMDFATLKYNNTGNLLWNVLYDYNVSSDFPADLVVDSNGYVYVTGSSLASGYPLSTMKYSQTVGINTISSEIPNNYFLHQNYPNPFNPTTRIKFDIPKASLVRLTVYDILGRQVAELVNQNMNAGTYEYEWSGAELSSGIYFYKLQAGEFVETRRMVLVK